MRRTSIGDARNGETRRTADLSLPRSGTACVGLARNGGGDREGHGTEPRKIEVRFHAPVHLLALFEEGARSDGFTCVEGLPRSALRNYRRKLVFVPSGHQYYDWQEPSSLTRAAYFYFDPAVLLLESGTGRAEPSFAPGCSSKTRGYGTSPSRLPDRAGCTRSSMTATG
jgi:hypothetical protein